MTGDKPLQRTYTLSSFSREKTVKSCLKQKYILSIREKHAGRPNPSLSGVKQDSTGPNQPTYPSNWTEFEKTQGPKFQFHENGKARDISNPGPQEAI